MEIFQNIYQFKLPFVVPKKENEVNPIEHNLLSRPVPAANVYMIVGNKGNLLIDTGGNADEAFDVFTAELKKYGFSVRDISQIVITHTHPDHSGLATRIAELSGASIYLNKKEAKDLKQRYAKYDRILEDNLNILKICGVPAKEAKTLNHMLPREFMIPVDNGNFISEGDKISCDPFEFNVIDTPGHSIGHICLYEPDRKFLFCGDTVLPEITPNIGYHPQVGKDMLGEFLKSARRIYDMDISFAFPGHGPAFNGIRQVIESLERHHKERERNIMNALDGKAGTAYDVAREISWNVDVKDGKYDYMSILDKRLAVTETVAHLEHMLHKKEISKMDKKGVNSYIA